MHERRAAHGHLSLITAPPPAAISESSHHILPVGDWILGELRWFIETHRGKDHRGIITLTPSGESYSQEGQYTALRKPFKTYVEEHRPDGAPIITSKDLRKSFHMLAMVECGCDETALDFYMGHAGSSIGRRHYSVARIDWMRSEVGEKIEKWVRQSVPPPVSWTLV